jgi:hypothetical protein
MPISLRRYNNSENPADYKSRHSNHLSIDRTHERLAEAHVLFVTTNQVPDALTSDIIRAATANDKTLQAVIEAVTTSRWYERLHRDVITHDFKLHAAQ